MPPGLFAPCLLLIATLLAGACATTPVPPTPLRGHLGAAGPDNPAPGNIPEPVQHTLAPPTLQPARRAETYSVVVNNVPVRELLFALARDARLNVDIHPGISGNVTLNAIEQTLPQLLTRIARQADLRHELDGPNLSVMPDTPFLRHYPVDYVNLARTVSGTVSTNTQIATLPGSGSAGTPAAIASGGTAGNISSTRIENSSRHQFWESLERNLKDLLRDTDKTLPEGSSETLVEQSSSHQASGAAALPAGHGQRAALGVAQALQANPAPGSASQASGTALVRRSTVREASSVIIHPESGIVTVRATQRQHERIQEFIDRILGAARRQVLIEATIVEVSLKEGHEQGIDWTQLSSGGLVEFIGNPLKSSVNLKYTKDSNPSTLISLLDSFGTTRVLSSPRLSVLNNQSAMLKVVENYVYFTVKADTTSTANVGTSTVYTTTPQTVSVGLVMGVTPQISAEDMVLLNVRPTITSLGGEIPDPNPELLKNGIKNMVPVIRTREIESVMRVASGNIAILGGLMEDRVRYQNQRVPLAGQVPLAGEIFNNRNNQAEKTELVIFLRPVVIRDPGLQGDYASLRAYLPDDGFFRPTEARREQGKQP